MQIDAYIKHISNTKIVKSWNYGKDSVAHEF